MMNCRKRNRENYMLMPGTSNLMPLIKNPSVGESVRLIGKIEVSVQDAKHTRITTSDYEKLSDPRLTYLLSCNSMFSRNSNMVD